MQHNKKLVHIYGASGHGKVVADIIADNGYELGKVYDDNVNNKCFIGKAVYHEYDGCEPLIVSIGDCKIRKSIVEKLGCPAVSLIHSSATISPSAKVGEGTVVMQGAVIQADASIGRHCIVNTRSSVDHDCIVSDFVHVASGATVCGGVQIGECTWLGAGSVIKQGVKIGTYCMIGAGAVVIKDVPDGAVVAGVPAKIIKYKEGYQPVQTN